VVCLTCEEVCWLHGTTSPRAEHASYSETSSHRSEDCTVVTDPVFFRNSVDSITLLVHWNHTRTAENNLIGVLLVLTTVAYRTNCIFLHCLLPFNLGHWLEPLVIEVRELPFLALFQNLSVFVLIFFPLPAFDMLIKILFLSRREVYVEQDFVVRLKIPIIILFDVTNKTAVYVTQKILGILFEVVRVVWNRVRTVPGYFFFGVLTFRNNKSVSESLTNLIKFTLEISFVVFIKLFNFSTQILNNYV
jgi:hypothetical protein